jgi:hypothetical protein
MAQICCKWSELPYKNKASHCNEADRPINKFVNTFKNPFAQYYPDHPFHTPLLGINLDQLMTLVTWGVLSHFSPLDLSICRLNSPLIVEYRFGELKYGNADYTSSEPKNSRVNSSLSKKPHFQVPCRY